MGGCSGSAIGSGSGSDGSIGRVRDRGKGLGVGMRYGYGWGNGYGMVWCGVVRWCVVWCGAGPGWSLAGVRLMGHVVVFPEVRPAYRCGFDVVRSSEPSARFPIQIDGPLFFRKLKFSWGIGGGY